MDSSELVEFLKDNLLISFDHNETLAYGSDTGYHTLKITLKVKQGDQWEVIDESSVDISL